MSVMTSVSSADPLRRITGVLAVVAHPDDESFGLGAVLSELVTVEVRVSVIRFTHGEASGPRGTPGDLWSDGPIRGTAAGPG